jgi:hypothetical protein
MINEIKIEAYGCLKTDSPFSEIFPSGIVPLESVDPSTLRHPEAPPCYVVDSNRLSKGQVKFLAELIYEAWKPECKDLTQAINYVETGLPLDINWFNGVGTDYKWLLEKDAINKKIS